MTTYTWEYGSAASGLEFTIVYDDVAHEFTVTSLVGSFDLNALWVSDGNNTADPYPPLAKVDKDLNMNGSNTVWDDGTSSTQAIVWDDYGKLSSAGLGSAGQNKVSFISSGETHTFALSDFVGLSSFDPTTDGTLGVRATSVNGNQTIKWVDATPEGSTGNNAPVITSGAQSGAVVEDMTLAADGTITFSDVDVSDTHTATFVPSPSNTPSLGTFSLDPVSEGGGTGSVAWHYDLDNAAAQSLGAGEIKNETYTVTIDDGHGSTTTQDVVITLTGEEPSIINVSNTSSLDESLHDISGDGRYLTWSVPGSNDLNVVWTDLNNPGVIVTFDDGAPGTISDQTNAHISGDGQLVTFTSTDSRADIIVWEPALDSSAIVPSNGTARLSDISDDGNHVVFSAQTATGSAVYDWNPNSPSDPAILVSDPSSTFAFRPAISGDGSVVVYEDRSFSPNPLESEIVVRDLTTGVATIVKPNELGDTQLRDTQASISADGNFVAFMSTNTTGFNSDVFVFDRAANGGAGELTNISQSLNGESLEPVISGDGRFVTFSSTADGDPDIYVWDRLNPTDTTHFDLPGVQRNPDISTDGRYVSFESNQTDGQFDIYVADNPLHGDFII